MEIGVLFASAILIFGSGFEVNCVVDGIKSDGVMKQHENVDRVSLFENSGSYDAEPKYAKMSPFYYNNIMKRSPIDRNTGRRQTGIIYGDGKPIGILQPYEESFKFMPIKEEKVYSVDGGRSDLDEQEPYLNLMYPLARFARSEDALKMAEYEAARAEFLEKHYPSMLVDFKIRDKLHSNRDKSTHRDVRKDEQKSDDIDKFEQKRDLKISAEDRKTEKCVSKPLQKRENGLSSSHADKQQMAQKREAEKPQKRETENTKQHETENPRKRETGNARSGEKDPRKRVATVSQKIETESSPKFKGRQIESQKVASAGKNTAKKKRENGLTDNQFDKLKRAVSKRASREKADVIENDLRGLLNDMGLIEDDLEENAEEMGKVRSAVNEDDDSEESLDNPALAKEKIESTIEQKMDDYRISERKKRTQDKTKEAPISFGLSDSDADTEERVDKKRSNPEALKDKKRVIDVNFITKNRDDKLLTALNSEPGENCSRASDIPNKREAETFDRKDQKKSIAEKNLQSKIPEAAISTTETYAQYEERVAREIKNKIQQLKEEVKRELGALEEDNDEEEEDEESVGEPQRKKRFATNTLMDEEANSIDPNSNADNAELMPHVRRRRMLSIDTMSSYLDQKEPVNLEQQESGSTFNKGYFEIRSQNGNLKEETLSNQDKSMEDDALKYLSAYKDDSFDFDNEDPYRIGYSNSRWASPPLYVKRARNYYSPKFQKRSYANYVPWNAVQKPSRDLNSGVYSYESEGDGNCEGGSDSRVEHETKSNAVVDATKKMQEWKYNSQALPKSNKDQTAEKPGGYNQNYYVYYLGKNQDKNVENPLPSGIYTRGNPPNNYQQMRMSYPQFYENSNRMPNKEQYMTASNDDENQKSMMFRIMYNVPSTRRRKRQVGGNFFVPSKDTEDAMVINTFSENLPQYVIPHSKPKNSTSFNSDVKNTYVFDNEGSKNFNNERIHTNDKGEKDLPNDDDETGVGASDSKTDFTPVRSEEVSEGNGKSNTTALGNEYSDRFDEERILDTQNNFPSEYIQESSDSSMNKPTQQEKKNENEPKYSMDSSNGDPESPEYGGVKSRKILSSSTTRNVEAMIFQNVDNTTSSHDNYHLKTIRANDSVDARGIVKYIRQNDMFEYEDGDNVPIVTTMKASMKEKHIEAIESRALRNAVRTSEEMSNLTYTSNLEISSVTTENSVGEKNIDDTKRATTFVDNQNRFDNFSSYSSGRNSLTLNKIDKNNVRVPNQEYLSAEWKRRKRGIEEQQQKSVRNKRLDWFWPIKSSLGGNTPQLEEYDQFEPYDASDSDKERFKDNSAGVDSNYEDLSIETEDYDRKKRQLQKTRPLFASINRMPYSNGGKLGRVGKYLPVSRRRRYADGWYREEPRRELLTDMSDVELFGALPQSYTGELNRYKRVKRGRRGRY